MTQSSEYGKLPPNLLHGKMKGYPHGIEIYAMTGSIVIILLKFGLLNPDFITIIPFSDLIIFSILIALLIIFLIRITNGGSVKIKNHMDILDSTKIAISNDYLISTLEIYPLDIETISLRERKSVERIISGIWKDMPPDIVLFSLSSSGKPANLNGSSEALTSYLNLVNSVLKRTYYFRHFLILKKKRHDVNDDEFNTNILKITGTLERIGLRNTIINSDTLEKLWRELV
ncbi:MAG: hypothetical protein ACYDAO_02890 [Thermoplasmataceae archaeon]